MAPRSRRVPANEHPKLQSLGLKTIPIPGDGNCLFYSLSDQMYGEQTHAGKIRALAVKYMADHEGDFKPFLPMTEGGGFRHHENRRGVSKRITDFPGEDQTDKAWKRYLTNMAKDREYGDDLVLAAVTKALDVDIKVHQPTGWTLELLAKEGSHSSKTLHIAFHYSMAHYSSIRQLNGDLPATEEATMESEESTTTTAAAAAPSPPTSPAANPTPTPSAKRPLVLDSDDEEDIRGPNKRQNRMVTATKKGGTREDEE